MSDHLKKGGSLEPGGLQTPRTKAVVFPNCETSIAIVGTFPPLGKTRVCPQEAGSLGRRGDMMRVYELSSFESGSRLSRLG